MPFTLAHPAAVLPLRRIPALHMVPLVIGAVVPDLPNFLPGRIAYKLAITHTRIGSVVMDLPLGMCLLIAVFLLRRPLTELLSARARAFFLTALERFGQSSRNWVLAPCSILVGVWTHLLWDSFTHPAGWGVRHLHLLTAQVSLGFYTGELCHILQYVSSVLGLLILAIAYARHVPPAPQPQAGERRSDRLLLTLVIVAAGVIGSAQAAQPAYGQALYRIFYLLTTRSLAWFGVLYLVAGTWRMLRRPEPELGSV